jgi:hypothetical protein
MKTRRLMMAGVLVLLACFILGRGLALAQAEVITPVEGDNDSITLSIINQAGNDVTGSWFPKPNEFVYIAVNNAVTPVTITLLPSSMPDPVPTKTLTTSAYPGQCTNFGSGDEQDFTSALSNGLFQLVPTDCGGMAVLEVTGNDVSGAQFTYRYIVPADTDFDGVSDNYEKLYCTQYAADDPLRLTCLDATADEDTSPEGDMSPKGDGIAVRDEARGFRVKGEYIQTAPGVKDLFVHFVDQPQCMDTAGASPVSLVDFFGDDLSPLFTNAANVYTGIQVHLINSDEWVDKFDGFDGDNVQYSSDAGPLDDRRVCPNALVPTPVNSNPPKGIRLIECLDSFQNSPLGLALKKAPPDGLERNDGNTVIFTQRIWNYHRNTFDIGGSRGLQYYTFENGEWNLIEEFGPAPVGGSLTDYLNNTGTKRIIQELFAFYAVHETIGHPTDLTPTVESTRKESYGYHHADGTGSSLDIKITQVIDRKTSGFNKFYIPKSFNLGDKREIRLLSSQEIP